VGILFAASGFLPVTDLLTAVKPGFPNLECGFKIQSVTHTPGKQYLIFVYYNIIGGRICKPSFSDIGFVFYSYGTKGLRNLIWKI
jgi:hypothetical protein